jgi:hypothetical protein
MPYSICFDGLDEVSQQLRELLVLLNDYRMEANGMAKDCLFVNKKIATASQTAGLA